MASKMSGSGLKPRWPGRESHLSSGIDSDVNLTVDSTLPQEPNRKSPKAEVQKQRSAQSSSPQSRPKKDVTLETWNPMMEDYNDKSFNSYNRGPGAGLAGTECNRPTSKKHNKYSLFVGSIPTEMTEEGLSNLFSHCCDILHVKVCQPRDDGRDTTFGFVDVPSVKDGEEAIRRLDGHVIRNHRLKVSFKREKERTPSEAPPMPREPPEEWDSPTSKKTPPNSKTRLTSPWKGGGRKTSSGGSESDGSTSEQKRKPAPQLRKMENRYGSTKKHVSFDESKDQNPTKSESINQTKSPEAQGGGPSEIATPSPLKTLLQKMRSTKQDGRERDFVGNCMQDQEVKLSGGRGQVEGLSKENNEVEERVSKRNEKPFTEKVPDSAVPKEGPGVGTPKKAETPKPVEEQVKSDSDTESSEVQDDVLNGKTTKSLHDQSGILGPAPQGLLPLKPSLLPQDVTTGYCAECAIHGYHETKESPHSYPYLPHHHGPRKGPYNPSQLPCSCCGGGYPPDEPRPIFHHHAHGYPHRSPPYPTSPYGPALYGAYPHHVHYGQTMRYALPPQHGYYEGRDPHPRPYLEGLGSAGYQNSGYRSNRSNFTTAGDMKHESQKAEPRSRRALPSPSQLPNSPNQKQSWKSAPEANKAAIKPPKSSPGGSQADHNKEQFVKTVSKGREHTGQAETPAKLRDLTSGESKKDPTTLLPEPNQERATQNGTSAGVGATPPQAVGQRSLDKETKEGQSGQKEPKQCVNCGKPGSLRCTKCKSTYCSADCQKEDWPKHKQQCRKVTFQDESSSKNTSTTSSLSSTPTQKSPQVIHAGTGGVFMARNLPFETPENVEMKVIVTEVESPSLFWVQLPQESSIKGLVELCESLNIVYFDQSSAAKFSYKAQVGGLCAAWYVADSSWYRAEVVSIDNQNCTVQLIDFGTMDVVSVNSLRKLEDKHLKVPKQALRCHLSGVQPILGTWTKEATEKLKTHVKKHEGCVIKTKFIGQRSQSHEVELYSGEDETQTLSSILIAAALAEKPQITPQSKPIPINSVNTAPAKAPRPVSVCDSLADGMCVDVCVSHVDSPSCFYAFLAESAGSLQELDENMNGCYAGTTPQMGFIPQPGKLFAARYSLNQAWYRGVTKELHTKQNPSLLVTFIDYGNSETVSVNECRPLEDRFSTLPWQAISCGLAGVKPKTADGQWPEEMTTAFQKWLVFGLSKVVIKAKQGDKLLVEIFLHDNETSFNNMLCNSGCGEDAKDLTANQDRPVSAAANQNSALTPTTPRRLPDAEIPPSEFEGFVTVVDNPNDFYLQVASEENVNAFKTFSEHLNTRYTLQDFTPYKPSVGDCCAAIFKDSAWYRALVLSYVATESAFKLLFVDFGNTVLLPSDRIRQLEARFYEMPMMALHCSLMCVIAPSSGSDGGWNDAAVKYFKDKVQNQQCRVSVVKCEDGKCDVELLYPVGSANKLVSVKRELLQKGWALMKASNHNSASKSDDHKLTNETPSDKLTPTMNASGDAPSANHEAKHSASTNQICALPPPKLPAEDFQGLVTVVGDHGDVYLQIATQENVDDMQSLGEGINQHYALVQQSPHEADVGELCAVQYSLDNVWYRGLVVSHSKTDQTASVLFVDFGNTEVVSLHEIQKLEKRFTEKPRMALHCYLSGLASPSAGKMWSTNATEHIKKQVLDKPCHIHVTKHDGESYEVEILYSNDDANWLSINQELIDEGLAKPITSQNSPGPSGDHASTNQKQASPGILKTADHNPESPSLGLSGDTNPANHSNPGVDGPAGLVGLPDNVPPPSEFTGVLTSVNHPCDFYLQIKNEQYIELSQVLRAELNQHYPRPGGRPHVPQSGELCAAKYNVDNEWYRAVALERSKSVASAFKVMFLDYGNCEEVPVDRLEKLEGDFLEVPSLAQHCCLSGVMAPSGDRQGPWSAETAAFISSKLIERDLECHVKVLKHDGKVCEVEIHYSSDDGSQTCNLKEELLKRGLAVPVAVATKPISAETRVLASSIAKATIPKDSVVNVMVNEVVSPLEFYCQIIDRDENLKHYSLMEDINSHAPDHPLTAPPMVGDLCLAKFTVDKTWYRTEILKLKQADKRALVYYLDFGNKEPLPWSRLAAASRRFTELPSQAIRCGLAGIPPGCTTDDTIKTFLREHLIGDGTNSPKFLQATLDSTAPNGTALIQLVHPDTDTNFNQVVKDMVGPATSPAPSATVHPTSSASPAAPVASPKVAVSDPAKREALKREMELKKQQLEAQIEAQRRELAEVEQLRASLEQEL